MPIFVIFYPLGYATGNVMGFLAERWLALGMMIHKVFSLMNGKEIADTFRTAGQPLAIYTGESLKVPALELYLADFFHGV